MDRVKNKKPAPKKYLRKAKKTIEDAAKHLPASPSPGAIAKIGSSGVESLDMFARYNELYKEAEELRDWSRDDKGVIDAPLAFGASIKSRQDTLSNITKAAQVLWDIRRMQQFQEIIVSAIQAASPEVAAKIIKNLEEADSKHGFTVNAKF